MSVEEIVRRRRLQYEKAGRRERSKLLDELQELSGYHRKSLIRLFQGKDGRPLAETTDRRRGSRYAVVLAQLHRAWEASYYACGKRLQPFLPELVWVMEGAGELELSPFERELLLSMSASSIDRALAPRRRQMLPRGRSTTKPGTLLREKIPIRTFADWNEEEAGFFEVDLVAHCGGSAEGEYLYTLDMIDVRTGWICLGATRGRGQAGTLRALDKGLSGVPFAVKGIDSDNDGAFINAQLLRYCEQHGYTFTRSRAYKKNDQCHVEERNWSIVRQFIGYARLETDEQLRLLQRIYALLAHYHNFFWPIQRLVSKERNGSKVKKIHDLATTPYRRVLALPGALSEEQRQVLAQEQRRHGPMALRREIDALRSQLRQTCRGQERGGVLNAE